MVRGHPRAWALEGECTVPREIEIGIHKEALPTKTH